MIFKEKRLAKNMTQTELAERLGISQAAVALWESGEVKPSADKYPLLARIFECTIDELFGSK